MEKTTNLFYKNNEKMYGSAAVQNFKKQFPLKNEDEMLVLENRLKQEHEYKLSYHIVIFFFVLHTCFLRSKSSPSTINFTKLVKEVTLLTHFYLNGTTTAALERKNFVI